MYWKNSKKESVAGHIKLVKGERSDLETACSGYFKKTTLILVFWKEKKDSRNSCFMLLYWKPLHILNGVSLISITN